MPSGGRGVFKCVERKKAHVTNISYKLKEVQKREGFCLCEGGPRDGVNLSFFDKFWGW